ncbi:MAG: PD40 domain-containing protein [Acidobacteria bacterium]|nr:PD40 domain-containing protein [Acidobacteriota bacterium]
MYFDKHFRQSLFCALTIGVLFQFVTGQFSFFGIAQAGAFPQITVKTGSVETKNRLTIQPQSHINTSVMIASAATAGMVAIGDSGLVGKTTLNQDGRFTIFSSLATNLVPGQIDTNNSNDVFIYDRVTNTTRLASGINGSVTTTGDGDSIGLSQSADGRYIVFYSTSTNLVTNQTDTNANYDVFLFDQITGATRLVSGVNGSTTLTGDAGSGPQAVISAGGQFIAFESSSTNLVVGQSDTFGNDVFLFNLNTGTTRLVSSAGGSSTVTGNAVSQNPSISADGNIITFESLADDLVTGQIDSIGSFDIFVFNQTTGLTQLASHVPASPTTTGNGSSLNPVISADGKFIAFQSTADNLVTGQTDFNLVGNDVFVFNQTNGLLRLVSGVNGSTTMTGDGSSEMPVISATGQFIVFQSQATNLVTGQTDPNGFTDIFLFDLIAGTTRLVSGSNGSMTTTGNFQSDGPGVSASGQFIVFRSQATDLVSGLTDVNGVSDIFIFDRLVGETTLVSHTTASPLITGDSDSGGFRPPTISSDGRAAAFSGNATNLIFNHLNPGSDVFVSLSASFTEASNNGLLVADTLNNRVQSFDGQNFSLVGFGVGSTPGKFRNPKSTAISPDGLTIFVADTGNNRVQKSTDGGQSWSVLTSSSQVKAPQGVVLDAEGNCFVADTGNNRVLCFIGGTPGIPLVVAASGSATGQVRGPSGLTITITGDLIVADTINNRIQRISTPTTSPTATIIAIAGTSPGQVRGPKGVATDFAGNIYVADTMNNRIQMIPSGGGTATILASTGNGLNQVRLPEGIKPAFFITGPLANTSILFVSDTGNNRLLALPLPAGTGQLLGGTGSSIGQFRSPGIL